MADNWHFSKFGVIVESTIAHLKISPKSIKFVIEISRDPLVRFMSQVTQNVRINHICRLVPLVFSNFVSV